MRHLEFLRTGAVIGVMVLWGQCAIASSEAAPKPTGTGRLIVDGEHVTQLILKRPGGAEVRIPDPGKGIELTSGVYDVFEIALDGGAFFSRPLLDPSPEPVTVEPNNVTTMRVGAPLQQMVAVERLSARIFHLEYYALDAIGNRYQPKFVVPGPRFDVYKGKTRIDGAEFQQGTNARFTYLWQVPLSGVGTLHIVPSWDALGELAADEGQPSLVRFKWFNVLIGLLVWLTLIPAVVFSKSNYTREAFLIFAPIALIVVLWWVIRALLPFDAETEQTMSIMVYAMTLGLAVLWLAAEELAACGGILRLIASILVMLMVGLVAVIGVGTGLTAMTGLLWLMVLLLTVIAMGGYVMAWWRCRDDFGMGRFILWLTAGIAAGGLALVILCIPVMLIGGQEGGSIPALLVGGIVFSLIVLLVNLPFTAVATWSRFYRDRLEACLGIE